MNAGSLASKIGVKPQTLYRIFKYTIFFLLSCNIIFFFMEEVLDSTSLYGSWIPPLDKLIHAYSAAIDSAAWVIMLIIFELETAVIPDEKLQGKLKWILAGIRCFCYSFIVYAFYGYCIQYPVLTNTVPIYIDNVCSLLGQGYSYVRVDNYAALNQEICAAMQGQDLIQIAGTKIISTVSAINKAIYLAIVDIINSGNWLIIIFILEVEVYLQLRSRLTDRFMYITKFIKIILYTTLLACAVYWGLEGDFLDFWDAFLWIVSFIFIEMNIFQWHSEAENEVYSHAGTSA